MSTGPYTQVSVRDFISRFSEPSSLTPTRAEREALLKIASGDSRIPQEQMRRLFMLRLVERELGRVQLTREGRALLSDADRARA